MSDRYCSVDGLTVEVDDATLVITLDRPAQRNVLDDTSTAGLIAALETAAVEHVQS